MTWQERAACVLGRADPALFDPIDQDVESWRQARRRADVAWRDYCSACPVAQACLDDALANNDTGIRAGYLLLPVAGRHRASVLGRQVQPCGTPAAWRRHRRKGEDCARCHAAARAAWAVSRCRRVS